MTLSQSIAAYLAGEINLDELLRRHPTNNEQRTIFRALRGKI